MAGLAGPYIELEMEPGLDPRVLRLELATEEPEEPRTGATGGGARVAGLGPITDIGLGMPALLLRDKGMCEPLVERYMPGGTLTSAKGAKGA